jgi:ketosteroid isomerase-like protein
MNATRTFVACVVAMAIGCIAVTQVSANSGNPDDAALNRKVVTEAFDRWVAGGTTFFQDVLHEDVVWTIRGSGPSAGEYRGLEDLLERAARPLAARLEVPLRPTSTEIWADGEHVIIFWQGEGLIQGGEPYRNTYAWIFEMRDGKAASVDAFLDLAAFDRALGRDRS